MSRSLSLFQSVLLGIVVLAALGLGTAGLVAVGNRHWPFGDSFHLQVGFRQVHGVEVGTRVRVKGVDAGEVEAVTLPEQPEQPVMVTLRLAGRFRSLVRRDATAQIVNESMLGGKVVEIEPGSASAGPAPEHAVITARPTAELADVLGQLDGALQGIRDGKGSLGKLYTDDHLYTALLQLAQQGRGTLTSIQQDADAIKEMPFIRNYVKDAHKLLVRPDCEANRQVFAESELFEPGYSVLTSGGRARLDQLAPWLEGLKHKGSEVVVASYADTKMETRLALTLSQKQSEAVCNYLKTQHAAQKMGLISRRPVTPIGLGTAGPPAPGSEKLPVPRVEVIVFVPQG